MKICPLFSGSSGNSTYVEIDEENGILIDCGRSTKQIESSLIRNEIDVNKIKAILITHEHTDHIAGLRVFVKKHNVQKESFIFKLFELYSKLFSLGDTFEIYAIKK